MARSDLPSPGVSLGPVAVSGGPSAPGVRIGRDLSASIGEALRAEAVRRGPIAIDRLALTLREGASPAEIEHAVRMALDRNERRPRR